MNTNSRLPDRNPFKVPDNYFEEASRRIISATAGDGVMEKPGSLRIRFRQYFAIAASVAVLAILSYTGIRLFSTRGESFSLNGIPTEMYSDELLNDLDLVVLEENAFSPEIPEEDPHIENQDIIDYLIKENIDINDIYEQL